MNKTKISAQVVADSLSPQGDRLTSLLITFPRIILSELLTHRMLSKNTSSSRAIPFNKMVESVQNDPFVPIAWQKHHSGMQGNEYHTGEGNVGDINYKARAERNWLRARDFAVEQAKHLYEDSLVTKQLSNRLLEPFMWTTMLITGSKEGWDNFFNLRCPQYQLGKNFFKSKKDWKKFYEESIDMVGQTDDKTPLFWLRMNKGQAEIHIMDLAEKIYDAMNESTPNQLEVGEWHIPFVQNLDLIELAKLYPDADDFQKVCVKISTAMSARTSYTVVGEERDIDYEKMIGLHDRLLTQDPPHSSPMEHCARAMDEVEYTSSKATGYTRKGKDQYGWCRNFKGFIPYRHIIETQNE